MRSPLPLSRPRMPAAAAVVAALVLAGCQRAEPAPEPVRAVRTLTVAATATAGSMEYAAEVRARSETRLAFRVPGKLVRRTADLGDAVRAGSVLAQLDAQDLRQSQQASQAALAAARVTAQQAEADYRRFKDLHDQGFIGAAELERRDTALKAARAAVEQATAQAAVQGNQAAYATLVADVSGVVTAVEAEPGQVLAAGTPVLRVAHDGPRDAVFSVPESQAAGVRRLEGKAGALRFRPWGGGADLPATVREVAAAADPVTRTFLVKADIGRADVKLGQTATVVLDAPAQAAAIRLPLTALAEADGRSVVWLLDGAAMTVAPREVAVAGASGNEALIGAGLKPGDVVVTAGVHVLTPGQKVKRYVETGRSELPPAATQVASSPKAVAGAVAAELAAPAASVVPGRP